MRRCQVIAKIWLSAGTLFLLACGLGDTQEARLLLSAWPTCDSTLLGCSRQWRTGPLYGNTLESDKRADRLIHHSLQISCWLLVRFPSIRADSPDAGSTIPTGYRTDQPARVPASASCQRHWDSDYRDDLVIVLLVTREGAGGMDKAAQPDDPSRRC